MKLYILLALLLAVVAVAILFRRQENFWGGVMPVPYLGQPLPHFDRLGLDAATDQPTLLVNLDGIPINQ